VRSSNSVAGKYTVKSGDTLSVIAAAHGTNWHALYAANKGVIGGNPNLILPGQVLALG
jgi:nucleoid-associated protein YgaU